MSSNSFKNIILFLFLSLSILLPLKKTAAQSNRSYFGFYASAGANAWNIREAQFNFLFSASPNDFINSTTSVSAHSVSPHIAFGFEFGGTRSYFASVNTQFNFGGMTGTYIDLAGGFNYPLVGEKVTLQIGAGVFYQIATKNLDSRRLRQSTRIDGRFFNNFNNFTTSLINQNLGIRPFATLKIATGRFSHLRIQGGYQFNFYDEARIRFKQIRNSGRNSNTTVARVRLDNNLFDFKYNDQYISRLPFDFSGFFVNIGIIWSL